MPERDNSHHDIILAKLEEKFSQLLEVVTDIKNNLKIQTLKLSELDREIITLKIESEQRQKEIDKIKEKSDNTRKWLMGILASILGGFILSVVKMIAGL